MHPATSTQLVKAQDPSHGSQSVAAQIAGGKMTGFAQNYVATRPHPPYRGDSPGVVMAYHTAKQLPVYAYLADQFCVCDHWFCSVPGETMPNRCYAVTGSSGGHIDALRPPQPYNLKSFCRHLDDAKVSWRWYSHDYVPMLWLIDPEYGLSDETIPAYFDRKDVFGHQSFLDHAASGDLPAVSWIDPNFFDLTFGPAGSNDDHPPSDLHAGQKLILELFDAIAQSPAWNKTLLLITYDEHGGFYDHVPPPAAKDDTPDAATARPTRAGDRVSPWVGKATGRKDRLRSHLDHQDDPRPLLPQTRRHRPRHGRPRPRSRTPRRPPHRDNRTHTNPTQRLPDADRPDQGLGREARDPRDPADR